MKKGTMLLIVCLCLAQVIYAQWEYTNLSQPKFSLGSTVLGSKVYFAGGDNGIQALSDVEVYDFETEEWDTILQMSVGKTYPACVASGTKVFFAGGLDWYSFNFIPEVDIWDTETKSWTLDYLSVPRFSVCAVAGPDKVLFAGGANLALMETYDIVDIYDISSGTWSVEHLSAPRASMAYVVAGDMAFFAGGFVVATNMVSDRIDIYHFSTGTWTIETLPEGRCFFAATAVETKVYFAGGTTQENVSTDRVDVYNIETGLWEEISSKLNLVINNDGIIAQYDGYLT